MNRLERGLLGTMRTKSARDSSALTLSSVDGWPRSLDLSSTEAAMKLSAVSACIEIISNSIAELPRYVMDEQSKKHLDDHYLGDVLWRRPNEIMTPKQLRQLNAARVLAQGNAYVWLTRDRAGHTVEMIPIPEGWCYPRYSYEQRRWLYYAQDPRTGQPYVLDPADVIHYKGFSLNGVTGLSKLERARRTIETGQLMEQYQNSTYKNGGRPSGVLTIDTDLGGTVQVAQPDGTTTTENRRDVVRREWEKYTGAGNAFRTAILDNGLKYEAISVTNADAQFVENKSLCVEDICRFFCLPPYKLGIGKQSYASNEQNNLEFVMQTLQPQITDDEQEDTWKLLSLSEQKKSHLRVRTNMAAVLRSDAKTRAEIENIYRMNGTYSVNDICDIEDLPHVPGGDTRYGSLNYIPLELFEQLSIARNARDIQSAGKEEA